MEILEYTGVKALGITEEACRRYSVPQVKTRFGIKLGAMFSPSCFKILDTNGSSYWEGTYDAGFGLFGQKAVEPGGKIFIVATEIEALKLASLGFDAVCLAEPKQLDAVTLTILADNLQMVASSLWVWTESTFKKANQSLEKFLLHLASSKSFDVYSIQDSDLNPIIALTDSDIRRILSAPGTVRWKPRGILHVSDVLRRKSFKNPVVGLSSGFPCIDKHLGGLRLGEIYMFAAGTGVGKSTITEEIAYELIVEQRQHTGLMQLENPTSRTVMKLAAIRHNIPVDKLRMNPDLLSEAQWQELERVTEKNTTIYDHFGSLDSEELFSKIDYMIDFEGCQFIILDHISIVVSGRSSKEGERKDIDVLMTWLASKAVSKNVCFICITHLSVPEGSPHEEGGRVTLSHLRGSGGIKQMSWNIIAQERNQQDPNNTRVLVRALKCRETGKTGPIGVLYYDVETGRLQEDSHWDPLEFEKLLQPRKGAKGNSYGVSNERGGGSNVSRKFISDY